MVTSPAELNIKDELQRRRAIASLSDTEEARQKVMLIFSVLVMVVIAIESIIAFTIRANRASALATEQRKLDQVLKELNTPEVKTKEQDYITLSAGFDTLKQKLDAKVDYGAFWAMIQDSQVKDVVYSSLAMDDKGNVRVDARTNSYEKVAKQLQSLKQHQCSLKEAAAQDQKTSCFRKVELTSVAKEETGVKFGIGFTLDQKILIKK